MNKKKNKLKYAIVGTTNPSINEILETFLIDSPFHELVAIFDESSSYAKKLSKKYKIPNSFAFNELEDQLKILEINVVYVADSSCLDPVLISLIDKYKLHFICDSPLYLNLKGANELLAITQKNRTRGIVAYHFLYDDKIEYIRENTDHLNIGNLKFINSVFNFAIKNSNDKRITNLGGRTPFYKIGMQCIQLARYIYMDEPYHIGAFSTTKDNPKYINIEDTTSVIMRFSHDRIAAFTISFGTFESSDLEILGENGRLRCENAYNLFQESIVNLQIKKTTGLSTKETRYKARQDYIEEFEEYSNHILYNGPISMNSIADAIQNMKIFDAIIDAIKLKKQITINPDGSFGVYDSSSIIGRTKLRHKKIQFEIERIKVKE